MNRPPSPAPQTPPPRPLASWVFSGAEVWLILKALGAVQPDLPAPPELAADADEVAVTEARLVQDHVLLPEPSGRFRLAADVEAVIRPAVAPARVWVLSIADPSRLGQPTRIVCFNWSPDTLIVNWVDAAAQHHFERHPVQDVPARVWGYITRFCDLNLLPPDGRDAESTVMSLERLLARTSQTVLLMAAGPGQPAAAAPSAMSWFISGRRAWLAVGAGPAGRSASPRPAGAEDIARAVAQFLSQSLPQR